MEVLGQRGNHRSRNEKCGLFFPFLLGRFSPGKNDCGKSVHVSSSKLKASFTPQWQPLLAFSTFEVWRGFGTSSDVPIIPPCNRKHLPGILPRCHPHPATFSVPAFIFLPCCHFLELPFFFRSGGSLGSSFPANFSCWQMCYPVPCGEIGGAFPFHCSGLEVTECGCP